MSYDISIWHDATETTVVECFGALGFALSEGFALHESSKLRVEADLSVCDCADVPDEVSACIAVTKLIELHFSFANRKSNSETDAIALALKIARALRGVHYNHQTDEYKSFGNLRFKSPVVRENYSRKSLLEIGWWIEHRKLSDKASLKAFYERIGARYPELLPKRYGDVEPLQFKLEEHGLDHFIDFILREDLSFTACSRPVISFDLNVSPKQPIGFVEHWNQIAYRCSNISLCIDSDCLLDEAWQARLRDLWLMICDEVDPLIYSEARLVHDYVVMGKSSFGVDGRTKSAPISGCWFAGIPSDLPAAAAVGPKYLELWPSFKETGIARKSYRYLSATNWLDADGIAKFVAQPPDRIAAKKMRRIKALVIFELPELFPFSQ